MLNAILKSLVLVSVLLCGSFGWTKDLTHRLGVGYKNHTSLDLPAVTVNYNPDVTWTFIGALGVDTVKDYSQSLIGGGVKYLIYPETNMNFYGAGYASLLNTENPADGKKSGVEIAGLFGVEFFLPGLENLGFNFEAGLALSTVKNSRFRTVGQDPLRAGMTFYF